MALGLAIGASPAAGSVTIGQLAPSAAAASPCTSNHDVVPVNTPGASYVVPNDGTITSWSTQARAVMGASMGLKIFRKIAEPDLYLVVGHDGPYPLTSGAINPFPANVAVKRNDLLGVVIPPAAGGPGCGFASMGDLIASNSTNLADGSSGNITPSDPNFRLNITAVFNPTNSFTIGTARNKKNGSATVDLTLPNPGDITIEGNGVKTAAAAGKSTAVAAGTIQLLIKAKGKKKKKLKLKKKVTVTPKFIYTPTGGDPLAQSAKVTLRKPRAKKKKS